MKIERWNFYPNDVASRGLDGLVLSIAKDPVVATACHKGMRRSPAAAGVLTTAGIPIANDLKVTPTICYQDFIDRNIDSNNLGLIIPRKTVMPFDVLMLFCDDSDIERTELKKVLGILEVEAIGVLNAIVIAHIRDDSGVLDLG